MGKRSTRMDKALKTSNCRKLEGTFVEEVQHEKWKKKGRTRTSVTEPVTDDDEFSECQSSMFIFQIPRLVRN